MPRYSAKKACILASLAALLGPRKTVHLHRRETAMTIKTETRTLVSLLLTFCLLLLTATALAKKGDKNFKEGMRYEAAQQWERAAQEFTLAVAADPSNL